MMRTNLDIPENRVAREVVDAAYQVHRAWGPGLLESAYCKALRYELETRGLGVEREAAVPVRYRGVEVGEAFRVDLLVEALVVVELKSVERIEPVHKKQVLTYLRLLDKRLGLLINFGSEYIRDGITRIANGMPDGKAF